MIVPQPQNGIIIIPYYNSCLFDYLILVYLQQKYVKLKSNCVNNIFVVCLSQQFKYGDRIFLGFI